MKLTIFILLLPWAILLVVGALVHLGINYGWIFLCLGPWMLASLVCFIRGLFIFRRHQRLAWCCFINAAIQLILAIWPELG
jgi:hypothetical protein